MNHGQLQHGRSLAFSELRHQHVASIWKFNRIMVTMLQRGWVLVDATYQPVDKLAKNASHDRDAVIAKDYPLLLKDLANLTPDRSVPLVLIKANVCRTLEPMLLKDGFTVLNDGRAIYFPSNGRQPDFKKQFAAVVSGSLE
jgi:hypothetical protein